MKESITITIDPEILERIQNLADRERRSVSSMIEVLLDKSSKTAIMYSEMEDSMIAAERKARENFGKK